MALNVTVPERFLALFGGDSPLGVVTAGDTRFGDGSYTRYGPIGGIRYIPSPGTFGSTGGPKLFQEGGAGGSGGTINPSPPPSGGSSNGGSSTDIASQLAALIGAGSAPSSTQGIYVPPTTPGSASSSSNMTIGILAIVVVAAVGYFIYRRFAKQKKT